LKKGDFQKREIQYEYYSDFVDRSSLHLDRSRNRKKSGHGHSSGNAVSGYDIKKLRELILELAVRGKLVSQNANDEPASELLKRIQVEKAKLITNGDSISCNK